MIDQKLERMAICAAMIDQLRAQRNALPARWDERLKDIAPRGLGPAQLTIWLAVADLWDHYYQKGPGYAARG